MASAPDVVLVTVDSLRADAVGDGSPGSPTPALDALALRGTRFAQAVSNGPRTVSAFPPIVCSLYPLVTSERGVPPGAATWAETMREAGYATAGFTRSNPYLSRASGYDRGFDHFEDFWERPGPARSRRRASPWKRFKKEVQDRMARKSLAQLLFFQGIFLRGGSPFERGDRVTGNLLRWVENHGGRPFAAWVHYMDVHYPYLPPARERSAADRLRFAACLAELWAGLDSRPLRVMRELYRRQVGYADGILARLLEGLRDLGRLENTLVAVTADHGEMLGEHGEFTHGPAMYDELLRVPLVVAGPGVPAGRLVEAQVGLLDLAPTLLDLAGVAVPGDFMGRSLRPLLETQAPAPSSPVFSEATHRGGRRSRREGERLYRIASCRTGEWKYVRDEEGQREELYNLRNDPRELSNLAGVEGRKLAELRAALEGHLAAVDERAGSYERPGVPPAAEEDAEMRERLALLGYL